MNRNFAALQAKLKETQDANTKAAVDVVPVPGGGGGRAVDVGA